jgi:signal transduction histidine kinase
VEEHAVDLHHFLAPGRRGSRARRRRPIPTPRGELISFDNRVILADGEVRWIGVRARPHFTFAGEPDRLLGVSLDITERKLAEEAVMTSEARLASAVELAGLGFFEIDIVGVPPDQVAGLGVHKFWSEHLHPEDRAWVLDTVASLHKAEIDSFSIEYRYLHPQRGEQWIHHLNYAAGRDESGDAVLSYGVARDVTERKLAELELRDLSRRLIRAHEQERALLARELHDDVSQRLAVLAIEAGRGRLGPEQAQASLEEVLEGLMSLSDDVHSLAYQLHPSVLEELGLAEALRAECERRTHRDGPEIALHIEPGLTTVTKDVALCLFRVAQEALGNVVRHAGAETAMVRLRQKDGGWLLAVEDDGAGFRPEGIREGMHLGLASMRERLQLAGGSLDIESAPAQGTTVTAWVPEGGAT